MVPRHGHRNRPRWETVARILAALIVLLLIAYGVAWYLGHRRPPPAGVGPPAAPAGEAGPG